MTSEVGGWLAWRECWGFLRLCSFSYPVAVLRDRFGDASEDVQSVLPGIWVT